MLTDETGQHGSRALEPLTVQLHSENSQVLLLLDGGLGVPDRYRMEPAVQLSRSLDLPTSAVAHAPRRTDLGACLDCPCVLITGEPTLDFRPRGRRAGELPRLDTGSLLADAGQDELWSRCVLERFLVLDCVALDDERSAGVLSSLEILRPLRGHGVGDVLGLPVEWTAVRNVGLVVPRHPVEQLTSCRRRSDPGVAVFCEKTGPLLLAESSVGR